MTRSALLPLKLNPHLGEPQVRQYEIPGKVRLSWNPDDDRFYLEIPDTDFPDEWRARHTYAHNTRGWHNATYRFRRLSK